MKKIFSTVAMAMVAFVSVVTMSSCQNDSPSSFNAAPQVPATTTQSQTTATSGTNAQEDNKVNYYYKAFVSNEMLSLFDVEIVRTAGTDVKKYTFSADDSKEGMMSTELDKITLDKNVEVSVKATFTVKANAQEVLDKMKAEKGEDAVINTTAVPAYRFPVMGSSDVQTSYGTAVMQDNLKSLTLAKLQAKAEGLSKTLSKSNK